LELRLSLRELAPGAGLRLLLAHQVGRRLAPSSRSLFKLPQQLPFPGGLTSQILNRCLAIIQTRCLAAPRVVELPLRALTRLKGLLRGPLRHRDPPHLRRDPLDLIAEVLLTQSPEIFE